jgi:hypothetical protein
MLSFGMTDFEYLVRNALGDERVRQSLARRTQSGIIANSSSEHFPEDAVIR